MGFDKLMGTYEGPSKTHQKFWRELEGSQHPTRISEGRTHGIRVTLNGNYSQVGETQCHLILPSMLFGDIHICKSYLRAMSPL